MQASTLRNVGSTLSHTVVKQDKTWQCVEEAASERKEQNTALDVLRKELINHKRMVQANFKQIETEKDEVREGQQSNEGAVVDSAAVAEMVATHLKHSQANHVLKTDFDAMKGVLEPMSRKFPLIMTELAGKADKEWARSRLGQLELTVASQEGGDAEKLEEVNRKVPITCSSVCALC